MKKIHLHISLPTRWSELTGRQIVRAAYYMSLGLTEAEYLVRLGIEFAGIVPHGTKVMDDGEIGYIYFNRPTGYIVLTAEQLATIADTLSWLTGDPEPMEAPLLDGRKVPDRNIYGVSVEQLLTADIACGHYLKSKDQAALRMMVAALYPHDKFDPEALQAEADRLARRPSWELEAVLLWFIGVKKMLRAKYPNVYSGGEGGAAPDGEEIMLGILSSLNEGDITKNPAIKHTDAHEALYELEQKIKASKASKKI